MRWRHAGLLVAVVAAVAVAVLSRSPGASRVELRSQDEPYPSLDALVAASDVIVVGRVADVVDGRVVTAAGDPTSGVRTGLATLAVTTVLKGPGSERLVVEEPKELLDGTEVTVDGVEALRRGDEVLLFLDDGGDDAPYYAVVGREGRFDIDGTTLSSRSSDPVAARLASFDVPTAVRIVVGTVVDQANAAPTTS